MLLNCNEMTTSITKCFREPTANHETAKYSKHNSGILRISNDLGISGVISMRPLVVMMLEARVKNPGARQLCTGVTQITHYMQGFFSSLMSD